MWFDQMAIPVDAPNPEGAHKFLNFIMDAGQHGCRVELRVLRQRQRGLAGHSSRKT